MRRFSPHPDGVSLSLFPEEAEALQIVGELLESIGDTAGDPAAMRLSVPAYPGHPDADEEFDEWLRPELETARAADRSAVATTLEAVGDEPVVLSPAEAEAWLLVLNEARLALAARMGITDEGWGDDQSEDELDPQMAYLQFLTYLHGELTGVLLQAL